MYNNNKDDVTLIPQRRRKTPSFSSTLLDSICRSIDESNGQNLTEQQLDFYRETTTTTTTTVNKQSHHHRHHRERSRSTVFDNWMEKQSESSSSNGSIRYFTNSSCGVTSSSSEESSCYTEKSNSHCYDFSRQKSKHVRSESDNSSSSTKQQSASNREAGGFSRTKLKALKMYGDLLGKKPISPGGRISKILNSIFNSGSNAKKGSSMCSSSSTVVAMEDVSTNYDQRIKMKTSNSKSSSTTRSCLSQSQTTTPSTRGSSKYVNGAKRSVRFYPVSVIVDEDSRPCGKKYIYEDDDPKIMSFSNVRQMSKSSITKKNYGVNNIVSNYNREEEEEEEDDVDDDDAMSCASSDLFELDHIIANNGRYREELPVFETTNIKTNRAIANGFIRRM